LEVPVRTAFGSAAGSLQTISHPLLDVPGHSGPIDLLALRRAVVGYLGRTY
jgi:hypothetical protein